MTQTTLAPVSIEEVIAANMELLTAAAAVKAGDANYQETQLRFFGGDLAHLEQAYLAVKSQSNPAIAALMAKKQPKIKAEKAAPDPILVKLDGELLAQIERLLGKLPAEHVARTQSFTVAYHPGSAAVAAVPEHDEETEPGSGVMTVVPAVAAVEEIKARWEITRSKHREPRVASADATPREPGTAGKRGGKYRLTSKSGEMWEGTTAEIVGPVTDRAGIMYSEADSKVRVLERAAKKLDGTLVAL